MRALPILLLLAVAACAHQPLSQPRVFAKPMPVPTTVERMVPVPVELTQVPPDPWPRPRITVGDWIDAARAFECAFAIAAYRLQAIAALDPAHPAPSIDLGAYCPPTPEAQP